jgi:hypothetical protein
MARKNTAFTLEDVYEATEEEIAEGIRKAAGVQAGREMEEEEAAKERGRGNFMNPNGLGRPGKYPWAAMRVGDSVEVLPEHLNHEGVPTLKFRTNVCTHNSKGKPKRWVCKRTKDEPKQWRLWRIM